MQALEKAVKSLAYALTAIAGIALFLMMVQTVVDVLLNNFMGAPIEGNLEVISTYHMVLVVFLPLAYVELKHEHINSDLVVGLMPARMRRAMYVFGALISCAFFGILAWQTWIDAWNSYRIKEVIMGSVYVEVWPAKFSLPLGFAAIFLVLVLHIVKALADPDFNPVPADPDAEPQ